jgi:hypothetical protein
MPYTIGRPREYNLEEIAKKLVEWAQKEDSVNLNGFCADNGYVPSYITRWARENETFCAAYEYSKACLGKRRERKLSNNELHVKAYDLNATVYDHFLKDEKRLNAEFEAKLKVQTDIAVNDAISQKYDQFMDMLKTGQERAIADSNSKADTKS